MSSTDVPLRRDPSSTTALDPRPEYARRLDLHREAMARQDRTINALGDGRLAAFVATLGLGAAAYFGTISPWWMAGPAAVFVALIAVQDRLRRRRRKADSAARFCEEGLARLDDRWAGKGRSGAKFLDPEHPSAADLDLFGPGSVFEWLCSARTGAGEAALAGWLLKPADPDEIRSRQEAVAELRPRLDDREALSLLGDDLGDLDSRAITAWGEGEPILQAGRVRVIADVLALAALATLLGWVAIGTGPIPFVATVLVEGLFTLSIGKNVRRTLEPLKEHAAELARLGEMLGWIETTPFSSPRLLRARSALELGGIPASKRVAALARLAGRLEMRQNAVFAPLASVLMWGTRIAFDVESWRKSSGRSLARWFEAAGDFEALASLAGRAFESPDDPFPEIVAGPARFEAEGLGHPLIAAADCVRNDLAIGDGARAFVVSGSNMSGKSTLLRSVGVNAVLAQAGGTVRARRLRISPLVVGATLRVQDSLRAGKSRFFAEILRVKAIVDLARGEVPLLFLLDEVFGGTNSRDRAAGAEGVIRGLLDLGAIGLVSTHDLALAEVADRLSPRAANVHFEDQMGDDGALAFDHRLRPGVVLASNALALMRAVGLDVGHETG